MPDLGRLNSSIWLPHSLDLLNERSLEGLLGHVQNPDSVSHPPRVAVRQSHLAHAALLPSERENTGKAARETRVLRCS